ncbi:YjbR protein [Pedococcus dokdonensis]|uniref:YjbR protein n=1 Tax=Pedococcus dokdonensis TaxID=443156 RepID=A0A1H0QYP6_9MICO|nr:MmcQ/YjbR family DNA-binding protein [Pedococcus dokdonensis]SDP22433.1 YjbR protein [Pedococcus dokdonensis]
MADKDADLDPALVARVASICLALPETHEQDAWIGVRWRIRQRTFAHLAHVDPSGGSVFGLAARLGTPADVITFRSAGAELDALVHSGLPFYKPDWSPSVVGMVVDARTDWEEVTELLTDSYCLMAPKKLARLVQPPS